MIFRDRVSPTFLWLFGVIYAASLSAQDVKTPEAGVVKIIAQVAGRQKIGTGFIVQLSRDMAYIVTASHVVEGDNNPRVEFFTSRRKPVSASVAGLEGGDPRGLALLGVGGAEKLAAGLMALPLAKAAQLKGGDEVTIIGFPQMAGPWSIIRGNIVSRTGREIIFSGPIDDGVSGGPMIKGERVVGLVTGVGGQYGHATLADSVQLFLDGLGLKPSGVTQPPVFGAPTPTPRIEDQPPRSGIEHLLPLLPPLPPGMEWKLTRPGIGVRPRRDPKGRYSAVAYDSRNGYLGTALNLATPDIALGEAIYQCKMAGGVPGFCESNARLVE